MKRRWYSFWFLGDADVAGNQHADCSGGTATQIRPGNINAYSTDAASVFITRCAKPLCDVPSMILGSQPTDGGNSLLTPEERLAPSSSITPGWRPDSVLPTLHTPLQARIFDRHLRQAGAMSHDSPVRSGDAQNPGDSALPLGIVPGFSENNLIGTRSVLKRPPKHT